MDWTCEMIEDTMHYLRVCKYAEIISALNVNDDSIWYFDVNGECHVRILSGIYKEMLDLQTKNMILF